MDLRKVLNNNIMVFDGAMGTMLQKAGLPTGVIPELYIFHKPDVIKDIHISYLESGCDIISTNTFGANRLKTKDCGYSVDDIISGGVRLAREAIDDFSKGQKSNDDFRKRYVALSLGPIGKLMVPTGEIEFEEACDLYREQIIPGIASGADLILIETQSDLYEIKAAVVTARELTDLPIICTMTFQEDGRMLLGADPLTAVTMLQNLGVDALGINCSLGPIQMVPIVDKILKYSRLPVIVQPNAGMPKIVEGDTTYDVGVEEFTSAMKKMLESGVSLVGGCCGTTPEYIRALSDCAVSIDNATCSINSASVKVRTFYGAVCSSTRTVVIDDRVRVIGERINPTGKKQLRKALEAGDYDYIENEAISQVKAGAEILDINVGLPGVDEKEAMINAMKRISSVTDAPLQIDSSDPKVIEAAARYCNGCPIINSVNGKQEVMDEVFPIVKKYGTCVIALTLDENGLPKNAQDRINIAGKIIEEAGKYGIGKERILVDCLTLTVSTMQNAAKDTLEAIRIIKDRFGVKTTLGASNISFGLPRRDLLNSTFLAMALGAGLDVPITDPLVPEYMDVVRAYETLVGKDEASSGYISRYGGIKEDDKAGDSRSKEGYELKDIILNGYGRRAKEATEKLLTKLAPLEIVERIIIPTLEIVGEKYESGEIFLPQLVQSADAVKPSFEVIKRNMAAKGERINYGKIVLATVKGDIHDIGKNIVKVLLENYGYEVLDLGKDVDISAVVDTVEREDVRLVGLSALMTTTVVNMKATIDALRKAGLGCKVAVGGAVLNEEYAKSIGADYYCKDAMDGVKVANSIFRG